MERGLKIIEEGIKNGADPRKQVQELFNAHPNIKVQINELKSILEQLKIEEKQVNNMGISNLLGGKLYYLSSNIQKDEEVEIKANVLRAYHLTTEILEELEFIRHINYVFTYDDGTNFYRAENIPLQAEHVYLEKQTSDVKMKLYNIKNLVLEHSKIPDNIQELLSSHYQSFIAPYIAYEKKAHRAGGTGWSPQRGLMSEAFERHYEEHGHSLEYPEKFTQNSIGNDLESEGRRWWMYKLSSGSAAFYTGPDTLYSQVKHWNATLINNIGTVINSMVAIINLFEGKFNPDTVSQDLQSAFIAAPDRIRITTKIWDGLTKKVQRELQTIMFNEFISRYSNSKIKKSDLELRRIKVKDDYYMEVKKIKR